MTDETPGAPGTEPPPAPAPDKPPARPTTRAGRKAAAEARKAAKAKDKEKTPKPASSRPRKAELKTRLAGSLTTVGTAVAAVGAARSPRVQVDGVLIIKAAPDIAEALDNIAKDDPRVREALERMLTVGVWGGLFAAMTPLLVGIGMNHGAIPQQVGAQLGMDAEVLDLIAQTAPQPAAPEQPTDTGGAAYGDPEPAPDPRLVGVH